MENPLPDHTSHSPESLIRVGDDSGEDSGFDDDDDASMYSSIASLNESLLEYRTLHGRTYHQSKSSTYPLPNDHKQFESLDLAHHWMTLLLDDQLHLAPVENPQRVLDVGTGTGIWAIDFADRHPSTEVIGTDISAGQPTWVPPNLRFLIDDCRQPWGWPADHFDLVHVRHLIGAVDDWRRLYGQAMEHLRPGGWFQHCDFDIETRSDTGLVGPDHVYHRWAELHFEAAEKRGMGLKYPVRDGGMEELMRETGFVNVVQTCHKIPIGGWMPDRKMKHVGLFTAEHIDSGLEGFALLPLAESLGWEYDKVVEIQAVMRKALRRAKLQPYFLLYITYGMKPT